MGFKRFSLLIGVRTALTMINLLVLTYLLVTPGYHAATVLALFVLVVQCYSIVKFTARTNAELVRFLDALKHADYSQRFELSELGSGFSELGLAFEEILHRFQTDRRLQEEQLRHLKAVIEHVPVPLISVKQGGEITLWNNAARRMFGRANILRLDDLAQFGTEFASELRTMKAGDKRLVGFQVDNMSQQLSVSMTQVIVAAEQEKLFSLQDIQNELDSSQLQAWQDLVKVLTHEIMNSITPVASLANTAADLIKDAKQQALKQADIQDQLNDIASAVTTVSRRSEGLMNFVSSYRKLAHLPEPKKETLKVSALFEQVIEIVKQEDSTNSIEFTQTAVPQDLQMNADKTMLEQMLINLVKNAQQATDGVSQPSISLNARLNRRGHVLIEIADNGPGIDDDIASKIFIPFFTTKKEGSGVGLALTRQVMNAHSGSIKVSASQNGGALFSLVF
ncbi:sensor histidine kinase [Ningiella sp. W23]|uniref:sensor histidine kinase n=1 Tax=Ningiella sp. W23 TaxID=3023715 RepID=UPI0037578A07